MSYLYFLFKIRKEENVDLKKKKKGKTKQAVSCLQKYCHTMYEKYNSMGISYVLVSYAIFECIYVAYLYIPKMHFSITTHEGCQKKMEKENDFLIRVFHGYTYAVLSGKSGEIFESMENIL